MGKRPGRKRKNGAREPNGQLQRPSKAMREEYAARQENAERMSVLMQPHRLGSMDQRCESALGRLCMKFGLTKDIELAAEHYASVVRSWRAAKGIPFQSRMTAVGSGIGPSEQTVRRWENELENVRQAIKSSYPQGFSAMRQIILDDRDVTQVIECFAVLALFQLQKILGFTPNESKSKIRAYHPFNATLTINGESVLDVVNA